MLKRCMDATTTTQANPSNAPQRGLAEGEGLRRERERGQGLKAVIVPPGTD